MRRLLLVTIALAGVACNDPDFDTPELLRAPRILAMQAEPPQPSYGEATTLRALIYQPPIQADAPECVGADPGPKYQWSWCPLPTTSTNAYECPITQVELDQMIAGFGLGAAPQLDLGTGETATLPNPFPAPLLAALCKGELQLPGSSASTANAGGRSLFGCELAVGDDRKPLAESRPVAFPVRVMMKYTPPCGSPAQDQYGPELSAVFTVRLPTDDSLPKDENPTVAGIYAISDYGAFLPPADAGAPDPIDGGAIDGGVIDGGVIDGGVIGGGAATSDAGSVPLAPPAGSLPVGATPVDTVLFPRQKRVGLWMDLPLSASQPLPLPTTADEPKEGEVNYFERIYTTWFAEAGGFGGGHGKNPRRGGYLPTYNQTLVSPLDEENFDQVRRTFWALPTVSDFGPAVARVVVVIRDSRGGVTWAQATATLEAQP